MTFQKNTLESELASLNTPRKPGRPPKAVIKEEPVKPIETKVEVVPESECHDLNVDNKDYFKSEWDQIRKEDNKNLEIMALEEPEEITELPPEYDNYRLVTVMTPFTAQGLQKNVGVDDETGDSYNYTSVNPSHLMPNGRRRTDRFVIRFDTRVVIPSFAAEILGNRADIQPYEGYWQPAIDCYQELNQKVK